MERYRTPMETWVTDCANVIWSPTNLFFTMFAPIIKQSVNFDFLDFLGWAVGDFLYLEFLYMSVYIFGKFCFWNFEDYHHVKIQFSLFKGTVSGPRQFLANESPLKMMKSAFYFTLKALFVLKIFMFLSWLLGHV